jgi:NADH-quinone oxidoreductase subunit J
MNFFDFELHRGIFLCFYAIGSISVYCLYRSTNIVHSVFYLILTFFSTAAIMLYVEIEFLAMIFLIVYVGAIAVLFLFVVMMFDVVFIYENSVTTINDNSFYYSMPFIVVMLISIGMSYKEYIMSPQDSGIMDMDDYKSVNIGEDVPLTVNIHWESELLSLSDTAAIGNVVYTNLYILFMIIGAILLVSMIGAIALSLDHYKKVHRQSIFKQISRNLNTSIILKK